MIGFTESFNLSVAVAIILQSIRTKLDKSDIEWGLSEYKILEKRIYWSKKSIKSVNDILSSYIKTML